MHEILIGLAKASILVALNQPYDFNLEKALKEYPILNDDGATFITLTNKEDNTLRGCIGSLQAHRPLYKDIIANSKSAAFNDSRFKPLTLEEFYRVNVEVSLLSKPKKINYSSIENLKSQIEPFIDGVILKQNKKHATYLPQVWEKLAKFDDFFYNLCKKANLNSNCLLDRPEIYIYQVKKYKEK